VSKTVRHALPRDGNTQFPVSIRHELQNIKKDSPENSVHWHVWRTANVLEQNGLSTSESLPGATVLIPKVVLILREWGAKWAGDRELSGLLNKPNLLHEVEESIVALSLVMEWLDTNTDKEICEPLILVDVCCGKGVFSMLASYIFQDDPRVTRIIMLDNDKHVNWNHVAVANQRAVEENRPVMDAWSDCNIFEMDQLVDRLTDETAGAQVAIVGIHLCKNLSPTCVGIVNLLGPEKCPFLCLAPCCLPRPVLTQSSKYKEKGSGIVDVAQYEAPQERNDRLEAAKRRRYTKKRGARPEFCILCESPDHAVHQCDLLPSEEEQQAEIFQQAAALTPCWNCGILGHFKGDCPLPNTASLVQSPMVRLDVSNVLEANRPFDMYCNLLSTTLERNEIRLVETGLVGNEPQHQNGRNWNRNRKSIFIIAMENH
jgi:hypothetical protein